MRVVHNESGGAGANEAASGRQLSGRRIQRDALTRAANLKIFLPQWSQRITRRQIQAQDRPL
jgi:hypothetical protein